MKKHQIFDDLLRGNLKKKPSKFTDIIHPGGGEVNPISKKNYKINFWQKEEREGAINEFLDD